MKNLFTTLRFLAIEKMRHHRQRRRAIIVSHISHTLPSRTAETIESAIVAFMEKMDLTSTSCAHLEVMAVQLW